MVLPGYIQGAAWAGDLDTMRDWLDNGGDINDTCESGTTIVNISTVTEELEAMKWAIARGADVNIPDEDGFTPLFHAVGSHDNVYTLAAINLLLDAGADIEAPTPKHQVNRAELRRG